MGKSIPRQSAPPPAADTGAETVPSVLCQAGFTLSAPAPMHVGQRETPLVIIDALMQSSSGLNSSGDSLGVGKLVKKAGQLLNRPLIPITMTIETALGSAAPVTIGLPQAP